MKLIPELFEKSFFTLLCAPIASGKTRLVVEFYNQSSFKIIYLSPLRALANEVHKNLITRNQKNVFLAGGESKLEDIFVKFSASDKAFLVATPELLRDDFLDSLKDQKVIIVIDEFHLFYYWGEDFRPILHDKLCLLWHLEFPILAVTATMEKEIFEKLEKDLVFHERTWFFLDYGNQLLHRKPKELISYYGLNQNLVRRAFFRELEYKKKKDILLYFCSYRDGVDELVFSLKKQGYCALGCVGGEVPRFLEELEEFKDQIDCIISTTTLSHGVNLPEIKKVFIDYEVKNYDFWLQMIGRGGRQGSDYEVYSCDPFHLSKKERFFQKIKIHFLDFTGLKI